MSRTSSSVSITVQSNVSEEVARGEVKIKGGVNGYINLNSNDKCQISIHPIESKEVSIKVYTLRGAKVYETIVSGITNQITTIDWSPNLASGIYVVRIQGGGLDIMKKVAVIR